MVPETTQHLSLDGQRVLLVAGTSGIGRQVARDAAAAGAHVTITSRRLEDAQQVAKQLSAADVTVTADTVDLSDEASMRDLAQRTGRPDHLVTLGSAPANGSIAELERDHIVRALDAKVIGPLLLVKHLPPKVSITLFSGIVAWRPQAGLTVMGTPTGRSAFWPSPSRSTWRRYAPTPSRPASSTPERGIAWARKPRSRCSGRSPPATPRAAWVSLETSRRPSCTR